MNQTKRDFPLAPLVGVGVVVIREHEFVLVKRGQPPAKGEWSMLGGLVELGEKAVDAAGCKVSEECGLVLHSISF